MYRGRRVRVATLVVTAFSVCCVGLSPEPARAGDDDEAHVLLFSGRDVWRNGAFLHGGAILAPSGFERDGILLKVLLSAGLYRYRAGNLGGALVSGGEWVAAVMPGWRMKRGPVEMKFFFGLEYQRHRLWPDDPDNRLRGRDVGLRIAFELWAEPTAATMIAADASLVSIGGSYSARAAFGWKLFDQFYAGPEAQAYGGDGYAQLRFGAHITSLKTGNTEWTAAGGWAADTDQRGSAYLRLGLMQHL